jgi:mannose-1-phosphate guanylyltransferase
VDAFHEKPDEETARRYISHNYFFWNAGIFLWSVNTIINAFRIYQPEISAIFEDLLPYYATEREQALIDERFPQCEPISVDYAILEKAEEIFVFPADFGWSDLGTWGSLLQNSERDVHGNACIGPKIVTAETTNSIIHTTGLRHVVVQGLDGYIVAENNDTLLICKLSEEQRIKQFSGEN